ncbi:hypothetical protein OZX74_02900 [Bifidobacterium sp. ESL0798]|uniref:hypothetical protein n=1 Tax=Bifidobacterium sp. ESL0798 TaxID=2983235 RepID=UPI0023F63A85|nr:hypothetical protein [Bifidobacterium sp. ESL0798]WEV74501.1 hypothetical protein OZX74_02900 [Bifidobacterium sp. ESL0798]
MSTDLTVISPLSWVQEAFKDYFDKAHMTDSSHLTGTYDYGFEPIRGIKDDAALWITADLLIANNAWRARKRLPTLLFEAPPADWLARLPRELTRRSAITAPVSQIRAWTKLPEGLGERPWAQLSRGRVPEFRAARRKLDELQRDLAQAPDDSLMSINTHLDGISEEWCVIVKHGKAVASSGYCVHRSQDENSHDILTVFDGARFHDSYRGIAESLATRAARTSHLDDASIIVGFRQSPETDDATEESEPSNADLQGPLAAKPAAQPLIIEADPVWCTAPYPYQTAEEVDAFLKAISDCRLYRNDDGTFEKGTGKAWRRPISTLRIRGWFAMPHIAMTGFRKRFFKKRKTITQTSTMFRNR